MPPASATAIYSRSDGIVAWQNCIESENDLAENIEVVASHNRMMFNPTVLTMSFPTVWRCPRAIGSRSAEAVGVASFTRRQRIGLLEETREPTRVTSHLHSSTDPHDQFAAVAAGQLCD